MMTNSSETGTSQPEFMFPEVMEAVSRTIAAKTDEIIRAADAGEPPVMVLIPELGDMISEGFYWRRADAAIKSLLSAEFEVAGKKPVGLVGLPRGRCYRRIGTE